MEYCDDNYNSSDSEINEDELELKNKIEKLQKKLDKQKQPFVVNVAYGAVSMDLNSKDINKITSEHIKYISRHKYGHELNKILTKLSNYNNDYLLDINKYEKSFVYNYLSKNYNKLKFEHLTFSFIELFIEHNMTPEMINVITGLGETWQDIFNNLNKYEFVYEYKNKTIAFYNAFKKYGISVNPFDSGLTGRLIYEFCRQNEIDDVIEICKSYEIKFNLNILLKIYSMNKNIIYSVFCESKKIDFDTQHFVGLKKIINHFYDPTNDTPELIEFMKHINIEIPKIVIPLNMQHFEYYYNVFTNNTTMFNLMTQSLNIQFDSELLKTNVEIHNDYHIINGKQYFNYSKEITFYKLLLSHSS